jgi:alpha-tubulin suppressor-like RCC1 family protein
MSNYYTLFKECFQRGNHLQMVCVGEAHTLVSNTNKIFSWGWNDYNQLGISDRSVNSTLINSLNLPTTAKPKSIFASESYSSIAFIDPPCIHYFGKIK